MAAERPTLPGPIAVGQVIDGFRVDAHLHVGGMADLWRVSHADGHDAGFPLLMKVPRLKRGEDPAVIVGFEVEQMIMPLLGGPHVPRLVAKGDFTRQPYIVMELVPGESLKARFDAAPIPLDEVVEVGGKVATALHDLHRQHLVHLDVKPSNVLFRAAPDGSRGDAVLVDFGLSRHARLPDLLDEEFALPLGTGPYMSPEQIRFVRDDPRSDLFALGVVLYSLATGTRPFGAPETVRGLRRRLYRDPVPPRAIRAEIPAWLQEVVLRCLEVDPAARHQSAAQLAFDLRHPDQVVLTERAGRLARAGALRTVRRWIDAAGRGPAAPRKAHERMARSPILLAAVDVDAGDPALLDAIRLAVQRLLQTEPGTRLACLAVMKTHLMTGTEDFLDADGASRHVRLLVQLENWALPVVRALGLRASTQTARVTFHVIEAHDPAGAIVDYARRNHVDHVVMGARSSGRLRRHLGSVSAQVAAEADCTVTVVRAGHPGI
jgi:nucleotide-binding universal stress UspA family protein